MLFRSLVERHRAVMTQSGERKRRRAEQAKAALWREIGEGLLDAFRASKSIAAKLGKVEAEVAAGKESSLAAARRLLDAFLKRKG